MQATLQPRRTDPLFLQPGKIGELGRRIYEEKYRAEFEQKYHGKIVAVNVKSGRAYVGDSSEQASDEGLRHEPDAVFYMLRVGFPALMRL